MIPINTTDTEIIAEALNVLYKNMTHSKVVRFLSMVRMGEGDYLKIKQDLFKEETVGSLIKKIKTFELQKGNL